MDFYLCFLLLILAHNTLDSYQYLNSSFGKIAYFNQNDYASFYYGVDVNTPSIKDKYGNWATIQSHGCGPTSVAIVAASMGRSTDPKKATQAVCQNSGCYSTGSSSSVLAAVLKNTYGIDAHESWDSTEVLNALKTGNALVIALMKKGHFTTGGHFIVLTGMTSNGEVSVADPNHSSNNANFSFANIIKPEAAGYIIARRS